MSEFILRICDERNPTREVPMDGDEIIIGRSSRCGIQLRHPSISREHMRLFLKDNHWTLEDLGSTHGTYMQGVAVSQPTRIPLEEVISPSPGKSPFTLIMLSANDALAKAATPVVNESTAVFLDAATILKESRHMPPGEGLRRYAFRLRELNNAYETFAVATDITNLKEVLLNKLHKLFKPAAVTLYLREEDDADFEAAGCIPDGATPPLSRALVKEISNTASALSANDVVRDARFEGSESIYNMGRHGLMASPLLEGKHIYGIATVVSTRSDRGFLEDDLKLLVALCAAAALRLRNIELGEQVAGHLRSVNRVLEDRVAERTRALTERNEELRHKNQEIIRTQEHLVLQAKMASLGTLTAGVAHEINNPNNFINGGAQNLNAAVSTFKSELLSLLEEGEQELAEHFQSRFTYMEEQLDLICSGSQRIKVIVDDLYQVSGHSSTGEGVLDIIKALRATANLMRPRYPRIQFQFALPASAEMFCRHNEITQVFANLIDNGCRAIDTHLERGGEGGDFHITGEVVGRFFNLEFKDTGHGMTADILEKVFEPFFTTREPGKGVGLGLYICYNIVKKHGGDMTVTSEAGAGCTFTLTLPLEGEPNTQ